MTTPAHAGSGPRASPHATESAPHDDTGTSERLGRHPASTRNQQAMTTVSRSDSASRESCSTRSRPTSPRSRPPSSAWRWAAPARSRRATRPESTSGPARHAPGWRPVRRRHESCRRRRDHRSRRQVAVLARRRHLVRHPCHRAGRRGVPRARSGQPLLVPVPLRHEGGRVRLERRRDLDRALTPPA